MSVEPPSPARLPSMPTALPSWDLRRNRCWTTRRPRASSLRSTQRARVRAQAIEGSVRMRAVSHCSLRDKRERTASITSLRARAVRQTASSAPSTAVMTPGSTMLPRKRCDRRDWSVLVSYARTTGALVSQRSSSARTGSARSASEVESAKTEPPPAGGHPRAHRESHGRGLDLGPRGLCPATPAIVTDSACENPGATADAPASGSAPPEVTRVPTAPIIAAVKLEETSGSAVAVHAACDLGERELCAAARRGVEAIASDEDGRRGAAACGRRVGPSSGARRGDREAALGGRCGVVGAKATDAGDGFGGAGLRRSGRGRCGR
jgi:hypothetical protein